MRWGSSPRGSRSGTAETIIRAGAGRAVIVAQCAPEAEAEVLAEIEAAAARMKEAGVAVDPLSVRRREAHEDEWRDVWKQYFRAHAGGADVPHPAELGPQAGRRRGIG